MATLITGGSGFIGRNLIAALHTHREVFGDIINASRRPFSSPFITKSYPCDIGLPYDHEPEFECLRYIMKTYKPEYIFIGNKLQRIRSNRANFNLWNHQKSIRRHTQTLHQYGTYKWSLGSYLCNCWAWAYPRSCL